MTMVTSENLCKFNQTGFCKHAAQCKRKHVNEICQDQSCNLSTCLMRHPRICKFFFSYGRCKFGEFCAYLHRQFSESIDVKLRNLEEQLKAEIVNLKKEIETIKTIVKAKSRILSSQTQSNMTITNVNMHPSNSSQVESLQSSFEQNIPQLDGAVETLPQPAPNHQCENCGVIFEAENALKEHIDDHEWGCDDCSLCLTSKYLADLHEIEYHGFEPDSILYIQNHVPESTKKQYEAGHRQR